MTGEELKRLRTNRGWSRKQLLELVNGSLAKAYGANPDRTIGRWERGERNIPDDVSAFLLELQLEDSLGGYRTVEGEHEHPDEPGPVDDSVPPPPPDQPQLQAQLPLPGGGHYARVCEELWEMVATGVGMLGAVTGSEALQADGRIILADKEALGKAYGKLAQTNQTFQRMLVGMTSSGAWMEVALVTGVTAGKMMRSHQDVKARRLAEQEMDDVRDRVVHAA